MTTQSQQNSLPPFPLSPQLAKEMFPKIQKAFSVLSDEQQRAIYDVYGSAGLEAGTDVGGRRKRSLRP